MRKSMEVKDVSVERDYILLTVETEDFSADLKPAGRMLADSDNQAFVYLMDAGEGYLYIYLKVHTWPVLAEALQQEKAFVLNWREKPLELPEFAGELWMLIENIEGNDNYGEEFSLAVEEAFREALASKA